MNRITPNSVADLIFKIKWESSGARHCEAYAAKKVNFWRDMLPEPLADELMGKLPGDQIGCNFDAGDLFKEDNSPQISYIKRHDFDPGRLALTHCIPRMGRFYPKGILSGQPGIFRDNMEPFRCVNPNHGRLAVDMGHPLIRTPLHLVATIGDVQEKTEERGGPVREWKRIITKGTGMQARWQNIPTDFFSDDPFDREDDRPDNLFYSQTRLIDHLDANALSLVEQIYRRYIVNGMRVLDLMGSWKSHLGKGLRLDRLTGLGLNAGELENNDMLTDFIVHDLNNTPVIPLPDSSYDAVICTVSVEYLTQPVAVFRQVARILKPGGRFLLTFSNRWFPQKAIRIWTQLHEFERMGLILEYFHQSKAFKNMETYSMRGLMRPFEDKYYGKLPCSDPIYGVWGERIA